MVGAMLISAGVLGMIIALAPEAFGIPINPIAAVPGGILVAIGIVVSWIELGPRR